METDDTSPGPQKDDASERREEEHVEEEHVEEEHFPVVGIGASAGGLEALQAFFGHLPDAPEMAFVVVQHLAPDRESRLADLLQDHTPLHVEQVTEPAALEAGRVYVIPPGKNLSFPGGALTPTDFEEPRSRRAPVDFFFRALAGTYGERAVGILLSGTGTGGTQGLGRIKEQGGIAMVQDPGEAGHAGMSRSAIAAGLVDVVAPVAELAEQLVRLRHRAGRIALPASPGELGADGAQVLHRIFAELQAETGHDFTHHKRASVLRRLRRRMQVQGTDDLPGYSDYLQDHPEEAEALFKDLLISVTSFFRDPEAFAVLEREGIPPLFEEKGAGDQVRVWVPGCATGKEAYSIAILLREHAAREGSAPGLQVFASDLDEDALHVGRQGYYAGAIEGDVSEERLKRFFVEENGGYRVSSGLRDMVVFARHNLLGDPPFSKLDLIACRNLLIYLKNDVQEQLFDLFHYALRPGGYLFLGAAESAITSPGRFTAVSKPGRLYRRAAAASERERLPQLPLRSRSFSPGDVSSFGEISSSSDPGRSEEPQAGSSFGALHRQLLEAYAPPSAVVDGGGDLVHLSNRAGRYLRVPGGEMSERVLDLVHPGLRASLRSALYRARREGQPAASPPVRVQLAGEDEERHVRVAVRPAPDGEAAADDGFLLVVFDETEAPDAAHPDAAHPDANEDRSREANASLVEDLQEELRDTRERLQATIEEYETSNEEMKAANEELQSMNEELTTVNQELEGKNAELGRARDDLDNLLTSTRIATLFLDCDLRLKRFTRAATRLFDVMDADLDRPFEHLTHRLEGPGDAPATGIAADAEQVLDLLKPVERELRAYPAESREERRAEHRDENRGEAGGALHLLMRILPYRTAENRIDGVVLTFVDITRRKEAEDRLRALNESLEERVAERTRELQEREASESALLRALPDPVLRVSGDDLIEDVHLPAAGALPWTREELVGRPLREALPERLAERLSEAITQAKETRTQSLVELIPGGEEADAPPSTFEARVAPIDGSTIVALRDITERRRLEREMLEAGDRKQQQIAEDLHDDLGQQLLGAHFLCRSLGRRLDDEGLGSDGLAGEVAEIAAEIDDASDYVRNLSRMLSAVDAKEGRGLGAALGHLAERTERTFGVACAYESEGAADLSGEHIATPLYRIAQEAVTNAVRHGEASEITIRCLADEQGLMLRIEDDGKGIDPDVAARGEGLGLRAMQHRADLIGARLDVSPRSEGGTSVACLLGRARLEGAEEGKAE